MSLFNELKRRNVFRVCAAYIVASWLIMQVSEVMAPALHLPEWIHSMLAFFLILGFFVAVVFAWAYEMTPEGLKPEREVEHDESLSHMTARQLDKLTIALLVAVVVMVVADRMVPEKEEQQEVDVVSEAPVKTMATMPGTEVIPSVAVLPFANISPDPDNEYFSDGISEELLNLLVKVEGLRVPSRTSSFAFKGRNTDIGEIARQLHVDHILEGSVRKAGNQVRITAQLIDVTTDTHLWSDTYDRELEDIFAIQDEIAAHIVNAMQLVLGGTDPHEKPTDNLRAYNLYLQGRFQFQRRGQELWDAERLLLQAVELDPEFAEAWGTLAMTYTVMPSYTDMSVEEGNDKTLVAAERARALDPSLPDPPLAIANVYANQYSWDQALDLHAEVLANHPRHLHAQVWYGIALLCAGYIEQALGSLEAAVALEPASALAHDWLARAQIAAGLVAEAERTAVRSFQLGRKFGSPTLVAAYTATKNPEPVRSVLHTMGERRARFWESFMALDNDPSQLGEALLEADRVEKEGHRVASDRLFYQYAAGTPNDFFAEMRVALAIDRLNIVMVWTPPARRFLRDPGMEALMRDLKLIDLWQSRGWPDRCRPAGDGGFECS